MSPQSQKYDIDFATQENISPKIIKYEGFFFFLFLFKNHWHLVTQTQSSGISRHQSCFSISGSVVLSNHSFNYCLLSHLLLHKYHNLIKKVLQFSFPNPTSYFFSSNYAIAYAAGSYWNSLHSPFTPILHIKMMGENLSLSLDMN